MMDILIDVIEFIVVWCCISILAMLWYCAPAIRRGLSHLRLKLKQRVRRMVGLSRWYAVKFFIQDYIFWYNRNDKHLSILGFWFRKAEKGEDKYPDIYKPEDIQARFFQIHVNAFNRCIVEYWEAYGGHDSGRAVFGFTLPSFIKLKKEIPWLRSIVTIIGGWWLDKQAKLTGSDHFSIETIDGQQHNLQQAWTHELEYRRRTA